MNSVYGLTFTYVHDRFRYVNDIHGSDSPRDFDLVTLGEPLIALTAADGRLPSSSTLLKSLAGAESNLAIGLARLGRSVALLSRVGDDPFGDEIVRTLRGEGVDTSWVSRDAEHPTGLLIKERRAPDDIHVYYYREGSAAASLCARDVPEEAIARARRVHVTGITLALGTGPRDAVDTLLDLCAKHRVPVSFDPNFRLKLWSVDEAAKVCTSLLPAVTDLLVGEDELIAMAGSAGSGGDLEEALAWAQEFELESVVVKRGARGVTGTSRGTRVTRDVHEATAVVDTVGAGDAFNAGYLHALMMGADFERALDIGSWVASRVVSHAGDYEGLPGAAELAAYEAATGLVQR